jgi:hypothetical protein
MPSSKAKKGPLSSKVIEVAKTPAVAKTARKRLPPPLRPQTHVNRESPEHQEQPCALLVNKVCALLSHGAEECIQARSRLHRRPGSLHQEQCASALRRYRVQVEDSRHAKPCRLVAQTKCRAYGKDALGCINAKSDAGYLSGTIIRACKAELLLFTGFP